MWRLRRRQDIEGDRRAPMIALPRLTPVAVPTLLATVGDLSRRQPICHESQTGAKSSEVDGTWQTVNHHLVSLNRERVGRTASPSAAVMDRQNLNRNGLAFLRWASVRLMLRKLCKADK